MAYTTINKSRDYFSTTLYTSNNGSSPRTISGVGHNPDMIWVKNRDSGSYNHVLADKVRGTTNILYPDGSNAQVVNPVTGTITSTNSDGFVLTSGSSNLSNYDVGSNKEVVWSWKANGQGSSNTDGSINTTYTSVDTASGFSISTYTGTGSASTIGHGLGVTPNVMLAKRLNSSGQWDMYHSGLSNAKSGSIVLNDSAAFASDSSIWNNTDPTSSLVNIGTSSTTNTSSGTYVMYCFAEKNGFSKFGTYTGNGDNTNGAFIYVGFKPAFLMIKCSDTAGEHWHIHDTKRQTFNVDNRYLLANTSDAESTSNSYAIDILSNGFKARTDNASTNGSGKSYIFMAFAEAPLVGTNNVPCTAR